MTTLAHENKTSSRTLLQPNPILRRLSKADGRAAAKEMDAWLSASAGAEAV